MATSPSRSPYIRQVEPRVLADRPLTEPHPTRLDPGRHDREAVLARHADAMAAGRDGYEDPATGLYVFTAASFAARDRCCDTGCRHCPYVT